MDNYFSEVKNVNKDIISTVNSLILYGSDFRFRIRDRFFSAKFKYNDILSGGKFVIAKFTINNAKFNILIPEKSFYQLISVTNDDLDPKSLPKKLLFQLCECLIDVVIAKIPEYFGLEINFESFEFQSNVGDPSIYELGILFHHNDPACNINMAIDMDRSLLNVFQQAVLKSKHERINTIPDIPIVAKLVLGSSTLSAENILSSSPEVLREGDVLVISNSTSEMDSLFVSIFDRFFYPASIANDTIVTTDKLVESSINNNEEDENSQDEDFENEEVSQDDDEDDLDDEDDYQDDDEDDLDDEDNSVNKK